MAERTKRNRSLDLVRLAVFALAVIAVVTELRKPSEEREWHGSIGPVPYDLRKPTLDRLRSRVWAPDAALIQPHAFGVGWTVNFGRAFAMVRSRLS